MTTLAKESGRLAWLAAALSGQRYRLANLLQRLTGFGAPGAMKSSVFRKFINMLDQISVVKEKENEIIDQIEAIEAKHRFQRKSHRLKYTSAKVWSKKDAALEWDHETGYEHRPNGWLWLLAFWALMPRCRINQKKQSLTVD